MCKCKICIISVLFGFLLVWHVTDADADMFTVEDFFAYSEQGRDSYVMVSVSMAGVIATQMEGNEAQCIGDWVEKNRKKGFETLFKVMRDYPDYHPQGIILAVLEKACGEFVFAKR